MLKVSVVIPTINRYQDLWKTLGYLNQQKFDSFEIIVVDQTENSESELIDRIKALSSVYYLSSEVKSASAARNIGIAKSNAEVILFLDDDVIIEDPYFIAKHYRHYADPTIPGVYGCPLEQKNNQNPIYHRPWISYQNLDFSWLYFPSNFGLNSWVAVGRSNNLSVRRNWAIAVGAMDENYDKGAHREEGDFCLRLYKKYGPLLFDPQARLIHIGNASGGIRSWNDNRYVKASHNIVGAIYFDLKMAPSRYALFYYFATLRYFILNATIIKRPKLWNLALGRIFKSYFVARKKLKSGPRYLSTNS